MNSSLSSSDLNRFCNLIIGLLTVLVFTGLCGCRTLENHFVYKPAVYPHEWNSIDHAGIHEVWFQAEDGAKLHGLYAPHPQPTAVILFAHGRGGNVTTPIENLMKFVERHQVTAMIFDYRGFGRSSGTPCEEGLYRDARAARACLAEQAGVAEREIVLMGRSLGAAVMVELAARDGARALILESAFSSLPAVVQHHVPWVPADKILINRFDSAIKVADYHGPLLISHGTDDEIIPDAHGKELFEKSSGPKHYVTIPGGTHRSEPTHEYQVALSQFLADVNRLSAKQN